MPRHLPAFQFYPGDWRKDVQIQSLDYETRGVWWELVCFLHEAEERGKLKVNGRWLNDEEIARMLGLPKQTWKQTRSKLEAAGVPGVDAKTGGIYSRRMVREEAQRLAKVEAGRLGGRASRPPSTQSPAEANAKQTGSRGGSKREAKRGSSVSSSVSKEKKYQKKKEAPGAPSEDEIRAREASRERQREALNGILAKTPTPPPEEPEEDDDLPPPRKGKGR